MLRQLRMANGLDRINILMAISEQGAKNNPADALKYASDALAEADKQGAVSLKGEAFFHIAFANYLLATPELALKNYQQAEEIFLELNNKNGIADCYAHTALVYASIEEYAAATRLNEQAKAIYEEMGSLSGLAGVYANLANIYRQTGDIPQATRYYQESLIIYNKTNDSEGIASTNNSLGMLHAQANEYEAALKNYLLAYKSFEQTKDTYSAAITCLNLGNIYQKKSMCAEAQKFLQKALTSGEEIGAKNIIAAAYQGLSDYEVNAGDPAKALVYYKLFYQTEKEILGEDTRRQVSKLRTKYESEQKEKEAQIYRLKNVELRQLNENLQLANTMIQQKSEELEIANHKLEETSRRDHLTQLSNRRDFLDKASREVIRYTRSQHNFCVILGDIDNFKHFNDKYGHDCGDLVLKQVAQLMCNHLRAQDIVARWGGEEFIFLLPETNSEGGFVLAEKVRKFIASAEFVYDTQILKVSLTFGLAVFGDNPSIESCIKNADQALYIGKENGKNCVTVWPLA